VYLQAERRSSDKLTHLLARWEHERTTAWWSRAQGGGPSVMQCNNSRDSHPVPRTILLYWDISRKSVIHFDLTRWLDISAGYNRHAYNEHFHSCKVISDCQMYNYIVIVVTFFYITR